MLYKYIFILTVHGPGLKEVAFGCSHYGRNVNCERIRVRRRVFCVSMSRCLVYRQSQSQGLRPRVLAKSYCLTLSLQIFGLFSSFGLSRALFCLPVSPFPWNASRKSILTFFFPLEKRTNHTVITKSQSSSASFFSHTLFSCDRLGNRVYIQSSRHIQCCAGCSSRSCSVCICVLSGERRVRRRGRTPSSRARRLVRI